VGNWWGIVYETRFIVYETHVTFVGGGVVPVQFPVIGNTGQ
jgi:hypothetical protein